MKVKQLLLVTALIFSAHSAFAAIENRPDDPGIPDHVNLPINFIQIGDMTLPSPAVERNGDLFNSIFNASGDGWSLEGEMTGEFDPWISFSLSISTTAGSGPIPVTMTFSIPILDTPSPNEVFGSLSISAVDATGDGVSVTPTNAKIMEAFVDDDLTGLVNMGVDVGDASSTAGIGSHVFGPFEEGPKIGPIHPVDGWDFLQVDVAFTISGNGDTVAMTGFASIIESGGEIPVPGAGAMGLVLLSAMGMRRSRRVSC